MGDVRGPLLERAQVGTWLADGVRVRFEKGEVGAGGGVGVAQSHHDALR